MYKTEKKFVSLYPKKLTTMEEINKSEGKCLFCEKTYTEAGINRHLATHLTGKRDHVYKM